MRNALFALSVASIAIGAAATAGVIMRPGMHGHGVVAGTAPANTLIPQIVGEDFPSGGTTVALTALDPGTGTPGRWDNSPTGYSYNWHTVNSPLTSLGTGSTLTLNTSTPGVVGQAVEVDVTATNAAGSSKVMSHWFGPIETSAPAKPVEMEKSLPPAFGSGTLPTEPVNWLQNGHAVFPGCDIPPVSPNLAAGHVWYFDPINGKTKDAGATGSAASPFKDVSAIFNTVAGYTGGKLFGSVIPPGDTIYLEPGDATHPVGDIIGGGYSTSDKTATGTVAWTWIMGDPAAAASRPVLHSVHGANGAGFIFKGFNVEQHRENGPIIWGGSIASPSFDIYFEDIHISAWLGHSEDPWSPSHFPTTGGASDGTIVSTAPTNGADSGVQDAINVTLTATTGVHVTTLAVNALPPMNNYVWSPNYYYIAAAVPVTATGIPNGSMVKQINGLDSAHYVNNNWNVNAINAAGLTSLHLGGTLTTTAGLPATNDGNYWLVQTKPTFVAVYTWNGTKWASIGSILPPSPPDPQAAYWITSTSHVVHWNGSAWVDLGAPIITLGPCDPVTDVGSGCPAANSYPGLTGSGNNNVPGCDPIVSVVGTGARSGGCPAGTPPIWQGTTRAIAAGEKVSFTNRMTTLPAGYWNNVDWDGGAAAAIRFSGQLNTAGSPDPANPNLLQGAKCMSVKDSTIRNVAVGMTMANVANTVIYNNKVKWVSVDNIELYTTNRVVVAHNYYSDSTFLWGHQDAVQFGDTNGHIAIKYLYGNAVIENTFIQATDTTNYFPEHMQGINTTENAHWGDYVCCNNVIAGTNGININGPYDVVVHNDEFPLSVGVGNQPKGATTVSKLGNTNDPTYSLLANNVASGFYRQNPNDAIPNWCTADHVTVEGNVSIPSVTDSGVGGVLASIYCDGAGAGQFGGSQGVYPGMSIWTQTDWRSAVVGVTSPVTDYHPVAPPINPAPGWEMAQGPAFQFQLCVQGFGACSSGAFGVVNPQPNASFAGTTAGVVGTVKEMWNLPLTTVAGDAYYAITPACFSGAVAPFCNAGVYQATVSTTLASATLANLKSAYAYVGANYTPRFVGAGVNLGPQQPIADINGNPWANAPSAGAFEGSGPRNNLHYAAGLSAPAVVTGTSTPMGFNLFDLSNKAACDALPAGTQCLLFLGDHTYDATTQGVITATANDPKVWGYYILDEPADADVPVTAQYVDFIHAHAPTKYSFFVAVNDNTPSSPVYFVTPANTHMTTSMDLIGIDPYPVRPASQGAAFATGIDLGVINLGVNEALAIGWKQSQLVPVYQAFGGPTGTPYASWTLPTAAQATSILSVWNALVPSPLFDYAYAWNQQQSDYPLGGAAGEPAGIQTQTIQLQQVFATHNAGGSP